jgi:hypothetical protein
LTVSRIGARSEQLALELAMSERARIPIDQNGLARCLAGEQVYEADLLTVDFPFPQRLARGGLRSLVMVPLRDERGGVFAVLVVARRAAQAFSSGECEFLRQLCDHVALAANQASCTPRCSRPTKNCAARRMRCSNRNGCARWGRWQRHRPRHQQRHLARGGVRRRHSRARERLQPRTRNQLEIVRRASTTWRTPSRAWASSIAAAGASRARAGEGGPRAARSARADARALERHAATAGVFIETRVESRGLPIVMGIESELRERWSTWY